MPNNEDRTPRRLAHQNEWPRGTIHVVPSVRQLMPRARVRLLVKGAYYAALQTDPAFQRALQTLATDLHAETAPPPSPSGQYRRQRVLLVLPQGSARDRLDAFAATWKLPTTDGAVDVWFSLTDVPFAGLRLQAALLATPFEDVSATITWPTPSRLRYDPAVTEPAAIRVEVRRRLNDIEADVRTQVE